MTELETLQEELENAQYGMVAVQNGKGWYELHIPGPAGGSLRKLATGNITTIRAYLQGYADGKKKAQAEQQGRTKKLARGKLGKLRKRLQDAENRGYLAAVDEIKGIQNGTLPDEHTSFPAHDDYGSI